MKIVDTILQKFLIPFRLVPKDGLTPEKLALSVTIGIIAGVFPVIGATTMVSLLLTLLFRQNLLVVQSVQWLFALVQLLLIIPFMQFGAFILNAQVAHINIALINHAFQPGILSGIRTTGLFLLYAILSWTLVAIPAGTLSYLTFLTLFQKKSHKQ